MAAGGAGGVQPGGDDGGVVAEQAVAALQVFREIMEVPVLQAVLPPMHHEQTRGIAPIGGLLGDKPVWQRIIEEIGLQEREN